MKRLVVFALLASTVAIAQPHDVEGWGKTKWGMTAVQLKKLFPAAKGRGRGALDLENFDIADVRCGVTMDLDGGRLGKVLIAPNGKTRRNAELLLSALVDKYGRPTSGDQGGRIWSFTSTTITLMMLFSHDKEEGLVLLSYEPPSSAQPNL